MEAKIIIDVEELSDLCIDIHKAVMNTDGTEENIQKSIQKELEKFVYKKE